MKIHQNSVVTLIVYFQTGAVIEDGQTLRNRQPTIEADVNTKSESEKLESSIGDDGKSHAEAAAESEAKVETEDKKLQVETVNDKPAEDNQVDTKPDPTEEIEVEVEEFYVKYKNL